MSGQTLTMLTHGDAGAGKSWLCDTAPGPRLICDAEGRAKYLPSQPKVLWDPRTQAPPAAPTAEAPWETCVAIVPDFATMDLIFRVLQSGQHPFRSVCVDSLMEIQMRLADDVAGTEQMRTQDWGIMLRKLEKLVRDYRDLVISPVNPTDCVVFTVGSKVDDRGRQVPMLQGQMGSKVPYFFDIVGYLYKTYSPETQSVSRHMLVDDVGTAVAKDGTGRLSVNGPTVDNPNLSTIFEQLNGEPTAASTDAVVQSVPSQPGGTAVT